MRGVRGIVYPSAVEGGLGGISGNPPSFGYFCNKSSSPKGYLRLAKPVIFYANPQHSKKITFRLFIFARMGFAAVSGGVGRGLARGPLSRLWGVWGEPFRNGPPRFGYYNSGEAAVAVGEADHTCNKSSSPKGYLRLAKPVIFYATSNIRKRTLVPPTRNILRKPP